MDPLNSKETLLLKHSVTQRNATQGLKYTVKKSTHFWLIHKKFKIFVFDNFFSRTLDTKFWLSLKKNLTDNQPL